MKDISPALEAHLALPLTTIATCWKATLDNGTVLGFTDHDRPLEVDGVVYISTAGYTASDVGTKNNLDVDDLEITGLLIGPSITEADLRAGLWDNAQIEIFQVNWADLSMGIMKMRVGWLGVVNQGRGIFKAELLGLMWRLQSTLVESTSAACRADLGDARCGVDLDALAVSGVVDGFSTTTLTLDDATRTEGVNEFAGGTVTFTSGANDGLTFEVKSSAVGDFTLQLPPPYTVAPGDTYSIEPGCDKARETCRDRYSNIVNFRGEPFLSGNDRLMQVGRR